MKRTSQRRSELDVAQVLSSMRADHQALHLEFTRWGRRWHLSNGQPVEDEVAQIVIQKCGIGSVGDALFEDVPAQTYRVVNAKE